MAAVELHVDRVDPVLVGDEPHGVLVCKKEEAQLVYQNDKTAIKPNAGLVSSSSKASVTFQLILVPA